MSWKGLYKELIARSSLNLGNLFTGAHVITYKESYAEVFMSK